VVRVCRVARIEETTSMWGCCMQTNADVFMDEADGACAIGHEGRVA
jgi:hypothetical protein